MELQYAHATLDIKAVDVEQRIIEGVASTPSPDRQGDVMEPSGAVFRTPFPFKFLHGDPVGEVFEAHVVRDKGIYIKAKFSQLDPAAPAHLHARIEEAWHSVKAKPPLVRGLSVGWAPIDSEPIKGTRYRRHKSWHLGEVSAVVVPANAECSITAVKHFDARPALSGASACVAPSTLPAAVGRDSKATAMSQPISAQIDTLSASLKTKSTRLEELVLREGTDGTLDAAEATERDTLAGEVETLSTRLKSFRALETAQAAMARPVLVSMPTGQTKSVQPYTPHVEVKSNTPVDIEFARYIICRMAALKRGVSAMELAKHYYPDNPRIQWLLKSNDWLEKDNVPAGTTTDATFAGPLVSTQNLASEFVEYLRPRTILGQIQGLTRTPFNVRVTGQTSGATGYWVGEGQSKPLTRFNFNAQTLGWAKVAAIIAITDELARFSSPSAEDRVRTEIVNALRERIDIDFVDPSKGAVANVSPASITNGLTNLNDTGASLGNVKTDIAQFFNAMIANNINIAECVWIMPQSVALQLSLISDVNGVPAFPTVTINGGTWVGLPVIVSQYMVFSHTPANNKVILLHPPSIALADDGGFTVDVSREASLEMDDQPVMASSSAAGSPSGPTGSAMVSMFQTNSIAIRAERYINWARLRDAGVVWMDDVRWAA